MRNHRTRTALIALFVLATISVGTPLVGTTASSKSTEVSWNTAPPLSTPIQPWQFVFYRQGRVTSAPTSTSTTSTTSVPVSTTTTTEPVARPPVSSHLVSPPTSPVSSTTSTAAVSGGSDATSVDTPDWNCIGEHESGNSYTEHGGGRFQFEDGTWESVTGLPGPAQDYPPAVQDAAALKLYSERGWEPWTTRFVCGL